MAALYFGADKELWTRLQEPASPSPLSAGFPLLLAALDGGWEIEAPVILLSRIFPDFGSIFIFNLRRPALNLDCRVIVKDCQQVQQFLEDHHLPLKLL